MGRPHRRAVCRAGHRRATGQPGVCRDCRDLIPLPYARCARCRRLGGLLDAALPITLNGSGSALHAALRGYKDARELETRDRYTQELAAVLWQFLDRHELCLAERAGGAFDVVATVPSSTPLLDELRPRLRTIVGEFCTATASRYHRVVHASGKAPVRRSFDRTRFWADADVAGASVLLIDDTWVTGARIHSAAYALRAAGAVRVAAVVLGRHITATHADNARRLAALGCVDTERCGLEAGPDPRRVIQLGEKGGSPGGRCSASQASISLR